MGFGETSEKVTVDEYFSFPQNQAILLDNTYD
jgi:hypothetical protein